LISRYGKTGRTFNRAAIGGAEADKQKQIFVPGRPSLPRQASINHQSIAILPNQAGNFFRRVFP
jgi:hypothetical protein